MKELLRLSEIDLGRLSLDQLLDSQQDWQLPGAVLAGNLNVTTLDGVLKKLRILQAPAVSEESSPSDLVVKTVSSSNTVLREHANRAAGLNEVG